MKLKKFFQESIAHEDQDMEFVIENLPPLTYETPTKRSTRQSPTKRMTNGTPSKMALDQTPNKRSTRQSPNKKLTNGTPTKDKTSPLKRLQGSYSPTKIVSTKSSTTFSPRKSPRKTIQSPFTATKPAVNVAESIKDILANLAPPTEEEIRAKRTPKPLQEIGNSPSKTDKSTSKMFAIFGKGFSENGASNSAKRQGLSKKKLQMATTAVEDAKSGLKQAVIDAGQKRIGVEHCLLCDFVFTVGDADEEKMHLEKHDQAMGIIKFTGSLN